MKRATCHWLRADRNSRPRPAHQILRLERLEDRELPSAAAAIDLVNMSRPGGGGTSQAPQITSASQTTFTIGLYSSFAVTATGTPTPTISVQGVLPSGVTFDSASDLLSGTPGPGTAGTYKIAFKAVNGVSPNASQKFVLTVNTAPVITSPNSTTFIGDGNTTNFFAVTAIGTPIPTFTETGALPAGITFSSGGVFSGQTTAVGTYPLVITASNGVGNNATQNFTLSVVPSTASVASSVTTNSTQSGPSSSSTTTGDQPTQPSVATLDALFAQESTGVFVGGQ